MKPDKTWYQVAITIYAITGLQGVGLGQDSRVHSRSTAQSSIRQGSTRADYDWEAHTGNRSQVWSSRDREKRQGVTGPQYYSQSGSQQFSKSTQWRPERGQSAQSAYIPSTTAGMGSMADIQRRVPQPAWSLPVMIKNSYLPTTTTTFNQHAVLDSPSSMLNPLSQFQLRPPNRAKTGRHFAVHSAHSKVIPIADKRHTRSVLIGSHSELPLNQNH